MKKIILCLSFFSIVVAVLSIIFSLDSKSLRQQEVKESLRSSLSSTANAIFEKKDYTVANKEEFLADFMQGMLLQIESDSEVTLNILDCDEQKGIISVEAIEKFKYPNGKTGTVSAVNTVILERKETSQAVNDQQTFILTYSLPGENGNKTYKKFNIVKNEGIIIPKDPYQDGKTFKGWFLNGSKYNLTDEYGQPVVITDNIKLIAKFE